MSDMRDKVLWMLVGVAIGTGVALLYAPKTGKETRRFLAKKAEKSGEVIADAGRELVDKGKDLMEKGRKVADEASDLFERGRRVMGVGA
jgi:gas vesicle protein